MWSGVGAMNPPDPTGDGVPGAFTVYGGGLAADPAGPSRASRGKKMPKVFAGWRFVLSPPPSSSLRLHRPARRSVTFERELEPGMDVLREQTPEPTGFDSDEADSGRGRRRDRRSHRRHRRLPWWLTSEGLAPYLDRVRGAPMIRLTRTIRGGGIRLFRKGPIVKADAPEGGARGDGSSQSGSSGSSGSSRAAGANNAENDGAGGLFRRSQVRVHACPDVAIGWRGSIAGGERDDDPVAVELDVQSALVPAGGRARHTAGLHIRAKILPRWFPNDRFEAGVSVEAYTDREPVRDADARREEEMNRRKKHANRRSERRRRSDGSRADSPGVPGATPVFTFGIPRRRQRTNPTGSPRRFASRAGSRPADRDVGTMDVRTIDDDDDDDDGEMDAEVLKAAAATVVDSIERHMPVDEPSDTMRTVASRTRSSRRRRGTRTGGGDDDGGGDATALVIRRRDAWWLRVRVWRGVFVKIGTRLRATPDGRIAFAAPTAEVQCEFDEDDDAGWGDAGGGRRDYWAPSPARANGTDPSDPSDEDEDVKYAESIVRSMRRERTRAERARAREANEALARSRREEREEARRREKEEKANARRAEAEYREEARRRDALARDLKRRAKAEREESERRAKAERTRAQAREDEVRRHAAEEAAARARVDAALKAEEAARAEEAALKAAEAILFSSAAAADEEELKAGISTGKHVVVEASPAASTDDADEDRGGGVEAHPPRVSPKDPVIAEATVGQKMTDPDPADRDPDSFAAAASDPPPPTRSDLPLPPPVPPSVPTADELRRLERDAVEARKAAEKASLTEKRRAESAARAARRERERLDALAEEEKKNRERDDASDVRAQAKRALEEKKRREAERASAEREARAAAREAQKREEKQRREEEKKRREAEKKRREAERAEERERKLADAARRRAEAEVIAREEAAAALEAEAEREARRALAAETRETLKAQRELKRRAERASASTSSPSREVLDGLGDERGAYESTPSKAVVS